MANSGKDRTCLDSPMPSSSIPEDYAMPGNDETTPYLSFQREEKMIFVTSSF